MPAQRLAGRRGPVVSVGPLPDLAVLLGSLGRPADLVLVEDWSVPATLPDADVVLWGRPPLPAGTSARAAAGAAARRAAALVRIGRRPPAGRTVRAVHRLAPPALRTGALAELRSALLQGVVVELAAEQAPARLLDLVCRQAGVDVLPRLRLGAGGALLALVDVASGPAVLRVGVSGSGGDPTAAAPALERLSDDPRVPNLLATGAVDRAAWTLESRLPGARPREVDAALLGQVADFCAGLPRSGRTASATTDLQRLAVLLPGVATRLESLAAQLDAVLASVPGIARHGDLWSGNLLVRQGRVSGVLDWDGWQADAVPGTDLLHLVTTAQRLRSKRPLGAVFRDRPWEWPDLALLDRRYWGALGLEPSRQQRQAIGVAWWAAQVGGDLTRTPGLASDDHWLQQNVFRVLAAIAH